jgi:hypothetical protein
MSKEFTFEPMPAVKFGGRRKRVYPPVAGVEQPRSNERTFFGDLVKLPLPSEPLPVQPQEVDTRRPMDLAPRALVGQPIIHCDHATVTGPRFPNVVRAPLRSDYKPTPQTVSKPRNLVQPPE